MPYRRRHEFRRVRFIFPTRIPVSGASKRLPTSTGRLLRCKFTNTPIAFNNNVYNLADVISHVTIIVPLIFIEPCENNCRSGMTKIVRCTFITRDKAKPRNHNIYVYSFVMYTDKSYHNVIDYTVCAHLYYLCYVIVRGLFKKFPRTKSFLKIDKLYYRKCYWVKIK